jgi:biopolymer transport protein ExbD
MAIGGPSGSGGGDDGELESVGGIFSDINITPLTDIFLVLLIIFMVTTTAIAESGRDEGGFKVNLPKGAKGDVGGVSHDITVVILQDGRVVVGGKVLDGPALKATFADAKAHGNDPLVMFQADEGVAHGRVVQVMEQAREAGLTRLAIATRADHE